MKNVGLKFNRKLCCGCGVCAGVCPTAAISMIEENGMFRPQVNNSLCTACQLCSKVCPYVDVDLAKLNCQFFGKNSYDSDIGSFVSSYTGFSTNEDLRKEASSGGVVSEILKFLIETKEITCAAVVRMKYGETIRAESILAHTVQEILAAKGSKYCPVHLGNIIRDIIKNKEQAAIVCLPCQAIALRKAMLNMPVLNKGIKYIISLFCGQCPSYRATDFYIDSLKIKPQSIVEMAYRGEGWPGLFRLVLMNGDVIRKRFPSIWSQVLGSNFYATPYCITCGDFFGEFADISAGDAWFNRYKNEKIGMSLVISRNNKAENILINLNNFKKSDFTPCEISEIKSAFAINLSVKKDIPLIIMQKNMKLIFVYIYRLMRIIKLRLSGKHIIFPQWVWRIYDKIGSRVLKLCSSRIYKGYF